MEGPFMTMSGKVMYYDPKAGMYCDRDSDIFLSYDAYMEYDRISPSQAKQMAQGPLADPRSKEYKAMERIKKKAAKSGMPYGILMKVYNRGMAAWRTGHRPGTTPQQWGMARVNSFVTKSSGTWGKADKDLAAKVRGK